MYATNGSADVLLVWRQNMQPSGTAFARRKPLDGAVRNVLTRSNKVSGYKLFHELFPQLRNGYC